MGNLEIQATGCRDMPDGVRPGLGLRAKLESLGGPWAFVGRLLGELSRTFGADRLHLEGLTGYALRA